jgi:hypothetical protein
MLCVVGAGVLIRVIAQHDAHGQSDPIPAHPLSMTFTQPGRGGLRVITFRASRNLDNFAAAANTFLIARHWVPAFLSDLHR